MPSQQAAENRGSPAKDARPLSLVSPIFRAFVSTIVPEAAKLGEPSWIELESLVDDTLSDRPANLHRQLRLLLRVIEWLPVLRYGRPFTSLGAPQRSQVLGYLQRHPLELIRTGFWGLRTLAFLGYYGRPDGARDIGYGANRRGWEALP